MKLIEEFKIITDAAVPVPIGEGPFGTRIVHGHKGGEVTGGRIKGKLLSDSDWSLIGTDNYLRIDARAQIETHDGAFLYVQYRGLLELNEKLRDTLATGGETEFEDQYCCINLQIETGDDRYKWVNTTFFVGQGRAKAGGGVEYRIFRAT